MRRFGFGKKGGGDEADGAKGGSSFARSNTGGSQSDNPYAQQSPTDPYSANPAGAPMTAYQRARQDISAGRQPGSYGGLPSNPANSRQNGGGGNGYQQDSPNSPNSPANSDGRYGAPPGRGGYGNDRYGSGGGYGGNRYDSGYQSSSSEGRYGGTAPAARGPGGYGGLGRPDDNGPDENHDALFAGAQQRAANAKQDPTSPDSTRNPASPDGGAAYGGYGEQRELTEEEQEEADYQATLAERNQVQQESIASLDRSLQMARMAAEVGQGSLARLGAQSERFQNIERNLDLAANENRIAQDKAAELKTLNRSMFAVHVGNPFTSRQRQMRADEEVMERHRSERSEREATRQNGYAANQRMESAFKELNSPGSVLPPASKKDYGKYTVDDDDTEGIENEERIHNQQLELSNAVSTLNRVGRMIGTEVDAQNKQLDTIMQKSDAVDDATRMNRERLARIK